jgi:hypothetical protein
MTYMHFQGPTFTMEVPTNWFVSATPQFQALFLASPTQDPVRANLAVSMRPVEKDVTVEAVAEAAKANQEREYPEYEVLAEVDFTDQGGAGFQRCYQWLNQQHDAEVIQVQTFFVVNQILYTLTATRSKSSASPELDDVFDHMVTSFRIFQD